MIAQRMHLVRIPKEVTPVLVPMDTVVTVMSVTMITSVNLAFIIAMLMYAARTLMAPLQVALI